MKDTQVHKLKILVCEANVRILQRLESWIMAMGEEVFTSGDAIVALQLFDEEAPDIVLVSQNLNNMGAIEFIEAIKTKNSSQAVILMLGSDAEDSIFSRSIDLQVDKYLNMPVDASILFTTIESLSQEKIWHQEFRSQKRMLQDYKDAIDLSFSVTKHDKNGDIFFVNDLFCTSTNLSNEDALKGFLNPLKNPNEDMTLVWDALITNKMYRDRQVFYFGENNEEHIVDITAVAMLNENAEVYEYLVFSNDVSEVVHSARKLKNQEIEQKIQKLEHKKEVNKIKDSFLTVFSHELKTPLNSIVNFSEYIKKHLLKTEFKKRDTLVEQITQINMSGWHMLDMIENLLDSMKLRDGQIQLNTSELILEDCVHEVLDRYKIETEDIKILTLFKHECILQNDEKRMKQVLSNIIANAIKYCKTKIGITLKVEKNTFTLDILDDGEGFDNTEDAFMLFSQSDEDNMTRTASGTGVGLYVVKELCDIMGYQVSIGQSKNLGGAKVSIKGEIE